MEQIKVRIKKIRGERDKDIPLPQYMTPNSVGMDLYTNIDQEVILEPGGRKLIPTGLAMAIPEGYEAQIRPRSGLALNHGITLLNSPGTIDSDYRGEIGIIMINLSKEPFLIKRGQRIAQMVLNRACQALLDVSFELDSTCRGSGGWGHTGS